MTAIPKVTIRLLLLILMCAGAANVEAAKYGKIMTKAVKEALGPQITPWKKDFKNLACFSYPTNNYGVPTSYKSPREFICDGWYCLGKETPAARDLSMEGFAAVGSGGTISLSQKKKNKLALGFVIPSIANIIGLNLGVDWEKAVKTDLTFGPAHIRRLRPDAMQAYIEDLPSGRKQKTAFANGDLVLTILDIVVDKMTVSIEVDRTLNPELDAQLQQKALDWLAAVENGGDVNGVDEGETEKQQDFSVSFEQATEGTYKIEISHPVIVCVWPKRQNAAGVLEAGDEWSDWSNLSDPENVVPVEK